MKKSFLILSAAIFASTVGSAQKFTSVTWENIQAHLAPLPVVGQLEVVPSSLEMKSFWSVGSETLDRDFANFENYKQFLGQTGVGYARFQSGWAKTEQKKGKYDFAWFDAHIDGCREQGVKPWVCLCYGNPIYSDHGHDLNARLFPDGPIMDGWLNYVKAVVKRYKGKVPMYEVWNEPDGGKNKDAYDLYANLFVRTAKAIREVDPDVKIAAFGACSPEKAFIRKAMAKIKELGGIEYIDYITYHAYWSKPEVIIPYVEELRQLAHSYSPRIELLQGETGCPGQLEYGHALNRIEWNEYSQVKWDCRNMLSHFNMGIPYSVFTMVDLNYGWMLQSYGLIRMNLKSEPQYKRPKFYMVQNVTSFFTPDVKPIHNIDIKVTTNREITAFGLEKNGKHVGYVLWFSDDLPSESLERELVNISERSFTVPNPVYVDLITGKIHSLARSNNITPGKNIGSSELAGIPVWDAPVMIIDKNALK